VTFLGYPDGGLSAMWGRHWSPNAPYTSSYTARAASPYRNSFRPHAPYCGESVVRDLEQLLAAERPTHLFLPDPGDDHPDHWATYCFGVAALEALRCRSAERPGQTPVGDWARRVQVRTYLIHRGDWPVPQGLHEEARLVPPASLLHLDTRWNELRLDDQARRQKREAIMRYRSQTAVMKRFLTSFVRQDEVFGVLPETNLAPLAQPVLTPAGLPRDWQRGSARMVDARRDTLIRRIDPAADLDSLEALADDRQIYLRLGARAPLADRIEYRLYLHPITGTGPGAGAPVTLLLRPGSENRGNLKSIRRDGDWQLALPRSALGAPQRVLVGAEARLGDVVLDRLSWRVLVLPGATHTAPEGRTKGMGG
jgi:LmbE family N-acetylglucosaminyl deacetylase